MGTSLQEIPKKVQYIVLDSDYVIGSNNTFTFNLSLEANTHAEDISQVIGIKLVDFYITQIGQENPISNETPSNIAKFIDIICPEIPQRAQMLNERNGQIFARVPLERHYDTGSHTILRDKQWRSFNRETNFFNPISIQKLEFKILESLDNGVYQTLQPESKWYMILEVTTIDVKEKPINREVQILQALYALIGKIDLLHQSVQRLPNKEEAEKIIEETKRKKFSFNYILIMFVVLIAGYIYYVNKIRSAFIPTPI
tara:strand:- start:1428 stop:2195 length:768 start_codon:yes stop_codon:yes gene_type:complete